jgi:hypothetical protein
MVTGDGVTPDISDGSPALGTRSSAGDNDSIRDKPSDDSQGNSGDGDAGGSNSDSGGVSSEAGAQGQGVAGSHPHNDTDDDDDNAARGDVIDVKVSFDGTWHKRGFTSLFVCIELFECLKSELGLFLNVGLEHCYCVYN